MRLWPDFIGARRPRAPRQGRRYLWAAIGFELCVLGGVLASPLVQLWAPRSAARVADARSVVESWRRSRYDPGRDPRRGTVAPPLALSTPAGRPVSLGDLAGRRVAVVFAADGST